MAGKKSQVFFVKIAIIFIFIIFFLTPRCGESINNASGVTDCYEAESIISIIGGLKAQPFWGIIGEKEVAIKISVIIPVYSEADIIADAIQSLEEINEGELAEIIVVDGHPGGTTIKHLTNPSVISLTSPKGRAVQMNMGARNATGEILLFLHADTILPPNGPRKIIEIMETGKYVGGAFNMGTVSKNLFLKHIYYTSYLRSRVTRIPYGDQAIFIRKDYFRKIGGYPDVPLLEDIKIMMKIKHNKDKIRIFKEKVITSSRRYEEEGMIYGWLRNHRIRILHHFGVSPERLAGLYPDTRRKKTKGF